MEDIKPQYQRKPRKDGSARKARVFGRPWWSEKAGWSEEKCNERKAAILERLREKWPDWSSFERDAPTEESIRDWIRPIVASFDDTSWCLPGISDPLKRLEEQLTIYSAWAKAISREKGRVQKHRDLHAQGIASESPQPDITPSKNVKHKIEQRYAPFKSSSAEELHDTRQSLSYQWRQTRPMNSWGGQGIPLSLSTPRPDPLPPKRKLSSLDSSEQKTTQAPIYRNGNVTSPRSFAPSFKADQTTAGAPSGDSSDDTTEITEVSDSGPLRHTETDFNVAVGKNIHRSVGSKFPQKWRDIDWDDVVVTVDASKLNGEYFPIPMTMLKPGSNRARCRWDDFELDDLYARFKVEAGFEIDRTKYAIVWAVNEISMMINTPGRYKLMLKEFSEKTPRSSAMVLYLRVVELTTIARKSNRDAPKNDYLQGWRKVEEKRSQFTGAASDYSSDSEREDRSEIAQPPLKLQRLDSAYALTPLRSESAAAPDNASSESLSVGPVQEVSSPQIEEQSDILKERNSTDESTQDDIEVT